MFHKTASYDMFTAFATYMYASLKKLAGNSWGGAYLPGHTLVCFQSEGIRPDDKDFSSITAKIWAMTDLHSLRTLP